MKLKMHEVVALNYELNGMTRQQDGTTEVVSHGLLKQKMNMKTKIYLQRLNKIVSEDVKIYEEEKQELFKKYGEQKDGQIEISAENVDAFVKEHEEVLLSDKDIDVANLWSGDMTIETIGNIETEEVYPVFMKLIEN
jgi:acylphosphatase